MRLANCLASFGLSLVLLGGTCRTTSANGTYVHKYLFSPEASSLSIDGGVASYHLTYGLAGSFNLVIHESPDLPTTFEFTRVTARLVGEPPFHGMRLDSLIGMTNWRGTLTKSFLIDFTGMDGQGVPMDVTGILGNVILELEGGNQPTCCDFLEYHLDAVAQIVSLSGKPLIPSLDITVSPNPVVISGHQAALLTPSVTLPEPVSQVTFLVLMLVFRITTHVDDRKLLAG